MAQDTAYKQNPLLKQRGVNIDFTKEQVNVLINSACELAVNHALKTHAKVTNKRRKVQSVSSDDETDLQEQVDQLKLYRDNKEEGEMTDRSSSSDSKS